MAEAPDKSKSAKIAKIYAFRSRNERGEFRERLLDDRESELRNKRIDLNCSATVNVFA